VSEWTERPVQALEQWLFIARQTQKDDAWKAVLRLAPGLFHDAALISKPCTTNCAANRAMKS
jgi:hypothetical protein